MERQLLEQQINQTEALLARLDAFESRFQTIEQALTVQANHLMSVEGEMRALCKLLLEIPPEVAE